jgi:hypothetical protein
MRHFVNSIGKDLPLFSFREILCTAAENPSPGLANSIDVGWSALLEGVDDWVHLEAGGVAEYVG